MKGPKGRLKGQMQPARRGATISHQSGYGCTCEPLVGDGEPNPWPVSLCGDKGYRADWIDRFLLELHIAPVIPSEENEDRSARLMEFDPVAYRRRNIVERLIGWLKAYRRVFSRFEKTAKNFGVMLKTAFIQRYLRLSPD
jgi:transposase